MTKLVAFPKGCITSNNCEKDQGMALLTPAHYFPGTSQSFPSTKAPEMALVASSGKDSGSKMVF